MIVNSHTQTTDQQTVRDDRFADLVPVADIATNGHTNGNGNGHTVADYTQLRPAITSPANGGTVKPGAVEVFGMATPGHTIQVYDWLRPAGGTVACWTGEWLVTVKPMEHESHSFTAQATDPETGTVFTSDLCAVTIAEEPKPQQAGRLSRTLGWLHKKSSAAA